MAIDPNVIFSGLAQVFSKPQVTAVATQDATKAAAEVMAAVKSVPDIAIVPVKSAWTSKINWTQAAGLIATGAAILGLPLTATEALGVVTGIQTVVAVVTWIIKTWFTPSVTAASAGKT